MSAGQPSLTADADRALQPGEGEQRLLPSLGELCAKKRSGSSRLRRC